MRGSFASTSRRSSEASTSLDPITPCSSRRVSIVPSPPSRPWTVTPVAIGEEVEGLGAGAVVRFDAGGTVQAKVGISYVDEAGALGNLDAEIPGWNFDDVRARSARGVEQRARLDRDRRRNGGRSHLVLYGPVPRANVPDPHDRC